MKKSNVRFLSEASMIAAIYAVLTIASTFLIPYLTFGPMQLRVAEALTILPVFTPAAIPGLFVGCVISNAVGIAMGANVAGALDILFGSAATLIAACLTYWVRKICVKGIPVLSILPPVLLNGIVVGFELSLFLPDVSFWYGLVSVGVSELFVCVVLGFPLYIGVRKTGLFTPKKQLN